jgi:protein KRI1
LPTRFRYHKVKPSNFGLTPVEILLADDKDLNEYVSLKKFAPYRRPDEQEHDIKKYSKKNRVQMFRHKLKQQEEEGESSSKKDKKKKDKKRKSEEDEDSSSKSKKSKVVKEEEEPRKPKKEKKDKKDKKSKKE